jgi:hypothetical protein
MRSVEDNIASDFVRMFRDFFYGAYLPLKVPRTMPCDADDAFDSIIEYVKRDAPLEIECDKDMTAEYKKLLADYLKVCKPLMRIGYRKAVRKYEKHGRHFANNLFWKITEEIDRFLKHAELYEGAEYKLRYGRDKDGHAFASISEDYSDFD